MIKSLRTKHGVEILVDDEDFEYLSQFKWHLASRLKYPETVVKENGKYRWYYMHRIIMGNPPRKWVDHKNGNPLDNRRENLRVGNGYLNNRNRRKRKNCPSKYKGLIWFSSEGKWGARIINYGIEIYLGRFEFEIKAAEAYNK